MHSDAQYPAFCERSLPCCVDAAGLPITSTHILDAKQRTACWYGDYFKLTVEDVFWDSAISHATHVAEASQATHVDEASQAKLGEESIPAGSVWPLQHICVVDVILPFDAKDAPEATYVKCVQATLLPRICRPCFTAVQQRTDDIGIL